MQTNRKLTAVFILALVAFMVSGGSAASASAATIQKLPVCTDPTGQNLPCMMIISTLPAPVNSLQCQETSGQILPCSYATQNLSNGEQIVAITVYVPANFVVSGTESFRVVKVRVTVSVHTTYSCQRGYHDVIIDGIHECVPNPPEHTPEYLLGLKYGTTDGKIGIYDLAAACDKYRGIAFDHCSFGYRTAYVTNCLKSKFGCGDGPTTLPGPIMPQQKVMNNLSSTSAAASVGRGTTCAAGNCTSGTTPPTVDCKTNPNDPSCTQSLISPPPTPPTTKTCPDGSVIDTSATCPTNTPPSNSPPPSSSTPPPSSSTPPSPPSSSKPSDNGGGTTSGGGGSDKGSSSPQPSRLQ